VAEEASPAEQAQGLRGDGGEASGLLPMPRIGSGGFELGTEILIGGWGERGRRNWRNGWDRRQSE